MNLPIAGLKCNTVACDLLYLQKQQNYSIDIIFMAVTLLPLSSWLPVIITAIAHTKLYELQEKNSNCIQSVSAQ